MGHSMKENHFYLSRIFMVPIFSPISLVAVLIQNAVALEYQPGKVNNPCNDVKCDEGFVFDFSSGSCVRIGQCGESIYATKV
jgi:hypothetical protein